MLPSCESSEGDHQSVLVSPLDSLEAPSRNYAACMLLGVGIQMLSRVNRIAMSIRPTKYAASPRQRPTKPPTCRTNGKARQLHFVSVAADVFDLPPLL